MIDGVPRRLRHDPNDHTIATTGGPSTRPHRDDPQMQALSNTLNKAEMLSRSNPAAAAKLYEQILREQPGFGPALFGLGDCKEAMTNDPKAAVPYYSKALFRTSVGLVDNGPYPGITPGISGPRLLKAALVFEGAGEHATAVKLYDKVVAEHINFQRTNAVPIALPILTDTSSSLELLSYTHVAQGIENGLSLEDQRVEFETAVAIKKSDVAEFYLNKHRAAHPELYKDERHSK